MTKSQGIPRLGLPESTLESLVALASVCPVDSWNFSDWPHGPGALNGGLTPALSEFFTELHCLLNSIGAVIIEVDPLLSEYAPGISATALMNALSALGQPLRIFLRYPHWRQLGVDLTRPANSSGGVGHQPLHMDFVNSANPPDLVCLLCLRPDPLGGGESLVASIAGIGDLLSKEDLAELSMRQFRDGLVSHLDGIGDDVNPFAVYSPGDRWRYRYTGKLLSSTQSTSAKRAVEALATILDSRVLKERLRRGDLLLLNQHYVMHGRSILGPGQEQIHPAQRRLLLQSFIRCQ